MQIWEIRPGAVYETARQQLRRVLRITARAVYYEVVSSRVPGYRFAMLTPAFAATAVKECPVYATQRARRRWMARVNG